MPLRGESHNRFENGIYKRFSYLYEFALHFFKTPWGCRGDTRIGI